MYKHSYIPLFVQLWFNYYFCTTSSCLGSRVSFGFHSSTAFSYLRLYHWKSSTARMHGYKLRLFFFKGFHLPIKMCPPRFLFLAYQDPWLPLLPHQGLLQRQAPEVLWAQISVNPSFENTQFRKIVFKFALSNILLIWRKYIFFSFVF